MKYKGIQIKQEIERIKARVKSKVPTKPTKERIQTNKNTITIVSIR